MLFGDINALVKLKSFPCIWFTGYQMMKAKVALTLGDILRGQSNCRGKIYTCTECFSWESNTSMINSSLRKHSLPTKVIL